ncbi:hypothetical protein ACFE04_011904 [Oxalis oulophora]
MATALFRMVASFSRNMTIATTMGSFLMCILFVNCGYVLSRDKVKSWWVWAYWISPLMYADGAIITNEFLGHSWDKIYSATNETLGVTVMKSRSFFPYAYWYWIGVGAMIGFVLILNSLYIFFLTVLNGQLDVRLALSDGTKESVEAWDSHHVCGTKLVLSIRINKSLSSHSAQWWVSQRCFVAVHGGSAYFVKSNGEDEMGLCWSSSAEHNKIDNNNITSAQLRTITVNSRNNISRNNRFSASSGDYPTGHMLPHPNLRIFTFAKLRNATKNFKPDTMLGDGGFGKVYKAWIDDKGIGKSGSANGIPCRHAIAVMKARSLRVDDFVSHWFKKELYCELYIDYLPNAMKVGRELWPTTDLRPFRGPPPRILLGRPRNKRVSELGEGGSGVKIMMVVVLVGYSLASSSSSSPVIPRLILSDHLPSSSRFLRDGMSLRRHPPTFRRAGHPNPSPTSTTTPPVLRCHVFLLFGPAVKVVTAGQVPFMLYSLPICASPSPVLCSPLSFTKQILILAVLNQVATALFRTIAAFSRNITISTTLGSFIMSILFINCGYILSRDRVRNWWIWAYWISPLMYADGAIISNEFLGHSWSKIYPATNETLGVTVMKYRSFFPYAYWYWIGIGAMIGFILIFNSLYIVCLTFLSGGYLQFLDNTKTYTPLKLM